MSMRLFELQKERQAALDASEKILARAENAKSDVTAEENKLLDEHMAAVKKLNKEIQTIESKNTIRNFDPVTMMSGRLVKPGEAEPDNKRDLNTGRKCTLRQAMQHATPHQVEELKHFARYLSGDMTALADLTPGGDAGVLIPTIVAGVVERNYAAFAPVLSVCRVWQTLTGEPEKFPVVSDTESATILAPAAATGADATVSGDTPPTALTGPTLNAYKFSSKPVFMPRETLTDSVINVLDEIMGALFARIVRYQNLKFTKGTGSSEPTGFMHDATAYAAGAVALDLDIALDLAYSVPPLYRPNGLYMASDTTIKYLRKLKTGISGDKRGLWKDVFEEGNATLGTPAKLHGYPILVNNDMDSVASDGTFAGVSPLAFGDFQRFVVRQAEQGSPYLIRYTVPAKDGSAVIAFQRSDSKLLVATAISKLTVS